ncbi:DUF2927 domain-containing protein [Roseivivax sp. CAU 1761]
MRRRFALLGAALAALLAGCTAERGAQPPEARPEARPSAPAIPAPSARRPPAAAAPSERSRALAAYYARVEQDLVGQGLLRTDGGGPDTPFTDTQLARNFEAIALSEEYERGAGLRPASAGTPGRIKKWRQPVRVTSHFGASVPRDQRSRDAAALARYVDRLAGITGHPMAMQPQDANFHVFFMGEDDRAEIAPRIRAVVPGIDSTSLAVLQTLPREIHCLVIAFADQAGGYAYGKAVALIRAEHPPLLMKSCIHEELAQGLGLANDSPRARPSIFNDDDEFALLTTHDELLLKILYDSRLRPGMGAAEAAPLIRRAAAELRGDRLAAADGF